MMDVFIVEDSEAMRENLQGRLSDFHDVNIVGYAADKGGAIEQINALHHDVLALDLNLLSGPAIDVLKNVKKHHEAITVMVLTNCTDVLYENSYKRAKADFFFDKPFQLMQVRDLFANWNKTSFMDNRLHG